MKKAAGKYINRIEQKMAQQANNPEKSYDLNPTDEIFKGDLLEKVIEMQEKFETSQEDEKIVKNKVEKTKKPITKKNKKVIVKKKVKSS